LIFKIINKNESIQQWFVPTASNKKMGNSASTSQKYDEFAALIIEHVKQNIVKDAIRKDEFVDWYINRDNFVKLFLLYAPIITESGSENLWIG